MAADVMGKSGRDMLDALVAGETDPDVLAQLARRQMRRRFLRCAKPLAGHIDAHHRLWIGAILAHIDFLDADIERLSDAIEGHLFRFAPAVELLCTVVGIQRRGAQCVLAEIGADMTRFPTAGPRLWAGQCHGNDQSVGKRRSGKTRDGSKWLAFALEEAPHGGDPRGGQLPRGAIPAPQSPPRPQASARRVKHSLLTAIWRRLSTGETYRDLGADFFTQRDPERQSKRLVKQFERLGHAVMLTEAAAAA